MIPDNDYYDESEGELLEDFSIETQPGLTWDMLKKQDRFIGTCDNLKAVKQAVYKILRTERYEHAVYSWNYGIETKDLFGENINYVKAEIKYRIEEALTQDERIKTVENFTFEQLDKHSLHVKFIVISTEGDFQDEMEVAV